ncbi:MAG: GNAT family N-acetyltransferase, partial [Elusimicrobia bacterium]|nr:GNAT family N-acetyltransferase [Elusimicrobiota bacterium]
MVELTAAHDGPALEEARALIEEYADLLASMGFRLDHQRFDAELSGLPGDYAPPRGRLLLARGGGRGAGCVGLRPLGGDACEMKRLYVR